MMKEKFSIEIVQIEKPEDTNVIIGTSHFIKSVEDIYEALADSAPTIKFGMAFCEASGPCLIRAEGNDEELKKCAIENAKKVAAGHFFIIVMKDAYPINVMNRLKNVPEVCTIYAATANPLQVIVIETEQGRGVLGVVDGYKSKGVETEEHVKERKEFLRKIGYKL
ncbi:MAG TPA: adenosine monophosphate-protein transferase [Candidatus Bathyarchaeota archaeon]|nr:adenosine monophosphate-protein transferase [Candidatus Bathyarchaeota archaeon]